ncbi:hypothetical protein L227DRAFT_608371 [Lentinus tigrinus ALCF2SS1-6]|uniref:Uncharacterized protein n=1 Tax=Lentinus tigrinus ALCF2SS1-6 TaxID=1328759 RepID=A0A5C2SL18_9APHY|nr:hypothetical protein L227DRAFT_608371 [Lentinus tigrinus ALCF2SS1-6]
MTRPYHIRRVLPRVKRARLPRPPPIPPPKLKKPTSREDSYAWSAVKWGLGAFAVAFVQGFIGAALAELFSLPRSRRSYASLLQLRGESCSK